MKKLAIAIPTYNEKDNLPKLIKEIKNVILKTSTDTTIIIIDDNSPDGTGKIADKLSGKYNSSKFKIDVIHRSGKLGLATAYLQAFKKTIKEKFDYILTMDADFSHKPEYIPDFLEKIKKYDLVIGSRKIKGGKVENWNLLRKIISKGGGLYARTILGVNIRDFTGGFNMFKRKVLDTIDLDKVKSTGYAFTIEMKYRTAKNNFSFYEIPIVFPNREKGKSKMSSKIFFEAMIRVWQLKFSNI